MNRFACFAFVVFFVQISLTETGLIKDVNTSFSENTKPSQNYTPDPDYNYKNTTWFVENEDYLTPNTNTSSQSGHNRPSGSHHNSGFSNGPDTSSESNYLRYDGWHQNSGFSNRPNTGTSWQYGNQRPVGSYQNSGFPNRPPNYGYFPSSSSFLETKTRPGEEWDDGNYIILTSDNSITCCYSNIKDERIENRHLRCNETDCVLERIWEKSSLWICKGIKCNIANVDFTKQVENKGLIECAMDKRNVIKYHNKPIVCRPDEREYKGRCRKIYGR